eukprot:CAMPEP_0183705392 /NCGR_PEP_ID=MMETSP0737-20130205/2493_1 /TAXON_ID=385413 /ORGANISM="Thalassiosira miniscula, Strain CCMP1093" /LENGTH=476 /DNA_ID=CAMNT_0025932529 /DNA_START=46 /DNA_END=1476 /DNA_ORIENTATION=+
MTAGDTLPPHLPVIIAGAGPCGLVAALTLQQHGVPFVVYEKAAAERLCSNAGSGFDMAPAALSILEHDLGLGEGLDKSMRPYEYMHMATMKGKLLTNIDLRGFKVTHSRSFGFASRATLQHALLDKLGWRDPQTGKVKDGGSSLHCNASITEYRQTNDGSVVEVTLSDGTTARGCVLLACDGIHSGIRRHMLRNTNDPYHYCGQDALWGKTTVQEGSNLDRELKRIAKDHNMEDGHVSIMTLGSHKRPGYFFTTEVAPLEHAWVMGVPCKNPPDANDSDDLTRRGGVRLTGKAKDEEIDNVLTPEHSSLIRSIMSQSEDITRAGLFDRENLSAPYTDGLVALLGDAAHPQSPMMGQGANMAICDGYVAATRIAAAIQKSNADPEKDNNITAHLRHAIEEYNCQQRRKENNKVIKKARLYGNWMGSTNRIATWALQMVTKYTSASTLVGEGTSGDRSNQKFLEKLKKDTANLSGQSF